MNYHNSMDRLAAIVSMMMMASIDRPENVVGTPLLKKNPSVKEISRVLDVPVDVIRSDLEEILKNPQMSQYIYCYDSFEQKKKEWEQEVAYNVESCGQGEDKEEDKAIYRYSAKEILDTGKFTDDTIVTLYPDILDNMERKGQSEQYVFFVSEWESVLLSYVFRKLTGRTEEICNQGALTDAVLIKENVLTSLGGMDEGKRQVIQQAMEFGKKISFCYTDRNHHMEQKVIDPRILHYNLANGHMYCLTVNDRGKAMAYRMDRMRQIKMLDQNQSELGKNEQLVHQLKYLWGTDMTDLGKPPVHVKIRINTNTHNILNKIKADVERRESKNIYPDGDYSYYEDDIIGMNAFRSWLYQYGSSVVVLEPKELAQEVYRSAQRRLKNYKEKKFTPYTG